MSWRELMADANPANHGQYGQNSLGRGDENNIGHIGHHSEESNSGQVEAKAAPVEAANVELAPSVPGHSISGRAVELIFIEPRDLVAPVDPKFPPCPSCGCARYWIASSGKVICGVCGETRFILASISYHAVN